MMRCIRPLTVLALSLASAAVPAQTGRYRDPVFPQHDVTSDVVYGAAFNRSFQRQETLRLDRYEPRGDSSTARPAIVIIHGGGFVGGDKAAGVMVQLGTDFARRGYVAVSINYRLARRGTQITEDVLLDAADDARAAVRYLRREAATLRIDPDRIACIGSSAGAFTGLRLAYEERDGSSGNPGFSREICAVVDLWGAMVDTSVIEAGEAPVLIIHGTEDRTVPFQGALDIEARAQSVGLPYELFPIQGAGHAPWSTYFASFHEQSVGFLYQYLALGELAGLTARPGFGSPGTLTIDTFGVAGDVVALDLSLGTAAIPLPGLGLFCLDPATTIPLLTRPLPTSPRLARASISIRVPPGLQGTTLYWQAVHLDAGQVRWLTNCVATAF